MNFSQIRSLFKREHIPKYAIGFASSFVPGGWVAMGALAYWKRKRQQKVIAIGQPVRDQPAISMQKLETN